VTKFKITKPENVFQYSVKFTHILIANINRSTKVQAVFFYLFI